MEHGDTQLVRSLIDRWYKRRADVEQLILERFDLNYVNDALRLGRQTRPLQIPGTDWYCWVHGIGVRVARSDETGGIDFDFDKPDPDPWRLLIFARAQVEEQSEDADQLRVLAEDLARIERAFVTASAG